MLVVPFSEESVTKLENTIVLVSPCCWVLGVPISGPSNSNRGVLSGAICGVRGAQLIIARRAAAEHRKYLDQRTLTPPVQHYPGHAGPRRHTGVLACEGFNICCHSYKRKRLSYRLYLLSFTKTYINTF